jgi:hypothetical protein
MSYGPADLDWTVHGLRLRLQSVPVWICPNCGAKQLESDVARSVSEYVRRIVTEPRPRAGDADQPLRPTEFVLAGK